MRHKALTSARTMVGWTNWACSLTAGLFPVGWEGLLLWDPNLPGFSPVKLGGGHFPGSKVTVLPDGRVVTGLFVLLMYDPTNPGHTQSCSTRREVRWVCCLTGGSSPLNPTGMCGYGTRSTREPSPSNSALVRLFQGLGVLADGRVVTAGFDGQVLMWDPPPLKWTRLNSASMALGRSRRSRC